MFGKNRGTRYTSGREPACNLPEISIAPGDQLVQQPPTAAKNNGGISSTMPPLHVVTCEVHVQPSNCAASEPVGHPDASTPAPKTPETRATQPQLPQLHVPSPPLVGPRAPNATLYPSYSRMGYCTFWTSSADAKDANTLPNAQQRRPSILRSGSKPYTNLFGSI